MNRVGIVIAAVIASGAPLQAQDAQERERFELFTECRPVSLVVVLGDDNGEDLPEPLTELTEERVRTLAESRLRAARLFSSEPVFPLLAISVEVVGQMSVRKVISPSWYTTLSAAKPTSLLRGTFPSWGRTRAALPSSCKACQSSWIPSSWSTCV